MKFKTIPMPRSVKRLFPQVMFAVDATKPIEVSVNRKDCKEAKRLSSTDCALARAAKREQHADGVVIGMSSSYIIKGDTAIRFATPERVAREIVSFDRHQDFAPGDYFLPPKSPSSRFGVKHPHTMPSGLEKASPKGKRLHHQARVRILPTGADK